MPTLGMKLDGLPTEQVPGLAAAIDDHGLEEVWICEDLGLNGGIAQSALALASTSTARVGHGIAPAAVRNVAYYAMEVASLCRTFPGRFMPGIGHGMPEWLRQVGAHPGNLLPCLEEVCNTTRRLLNGESVTFSGQHVNVASVTLFYPPEHVPPLSLGVRGPRGMELASRIADGVILAEGSGPSYVRGAKAQLGSRGHRVTVFVWFYMGANSATARERIWPVVEKALDREYMQAQFQHFGPDTSQEFLMEELTVSGNAEDCAAAIQKLYAAGADAVVLQTLPGLELKQLRHIARELLPLFTS